MSKNYQDDMFTPNSSLKLFSQLQGPKKLLLNRAGMRCRKSCALLGAGITTSTTRRTRWFDYWLKGKRQRHHERDADRQVETSPVASVLSAWPDPNVNQQTF